MRKFAEGWRGAVITDNEFKDALVGENLSMLLGHGLNEALLTEYSEGDEILVTLVVKKA